MSEDVDPIIKEIAEELNRIIEKWNFIRFSDAVKPIQLRHERERVEQEKKDAKQEHNDRVSVCVDQFINKEVPEPVTDLDLKVIHDAFDDGVLSCLIDLKSTQKSNVVRNLNRLCVPMTRMWDIGSYFAFIKIIYEPSGKIIYELPGKDDPYGACVLKCVEKLTSGICTEPFVVDKILCDAVLHIRYNIQNYSPEQRSYVIENAEPLIALGSPMWDCHVFRLICSTRFEFVAQKIKQRRIHSQAAVVIKPPVPENLDKPPAPIMLQGELGTIVKNYGRGPFIVAVEHIKSKREQEYKQKCEHKQRVDKCVEQFANGKVYVTDLRVLHDGFREVCRLDSLSSAQKDNILNNINRLRVLIRWVEVMDSYFYFIDCHSLSIKGNLCILECVERLTSGIYEGTFGINKIFCDALLYIYQNRENYSIEQLNNVLIYTEALENSYHLDECREHPIWSTLMFELFRALYIKMKKSPAQKLLAQEQPAQELAQEPLAVARDLNYK